MASNSFSVNGMEDDLSLVDVHVKVYDWEKDGSITVLSIQAEVVLLEDMPVPFSPTMTGEREREREGERERECCHGRVCVFTMENTHVVHCTDPTYCLSIAQNLGRNLFTNNTFVGCTPRWRVPTKHSGAQVHQCFSKVVITFWHNN